MVQRQFFLKRGLALFLFNFFKVYHFYIYRLIYPLCYAFEEKNFFCHRNFIKKGHSKLSRFDRNQQLNR